MIGRQLPSHASVIGKEAIREAIQHHMDRLEPNKTKADYNPYKGITPVSEHQGSAAETQRAHMLNKEHPNRTFFTPAQAKWAGKQAMRNNPLGTLGNRAEHFLQLRGVGKELVNSYNPTNRGGIANLAALFAGGPKGGGDEFIGGPRGDASQMMDKLGMPGQFTRYGSTVYKTGSALDRGMPREGPRGMGGGNQGAGIRGLVRRAEGVGGYRQPDPGLAEMGRLEALRREQVKRSQTRDEIKNYSNRVGGMQNIAKQAQERMDTLGKIDQKFGSNLFPHHIGEQFRPEASPEAFPSADINSTSKLNGLDNFAEYLAHYMQKNNFSMGASKAMHDLLFGGTLFRAPGAGEIPRRPGG